MRSRSRSRDLQDTVERGVWGQLVHVDGAGSHISVRGTGTLDEEVPILNTGYGFNLPADSNAEITMFSMGSDVNDKFALPQIPRDKQHQWGEGEGGIQHPTDPERRLEFNGQDTWLKDGSYRLGPNGEINLTVSNGTVTITGGNIVLDGDVNITGSLSVDGSSVEHNGTNIGSSHRHGGVEDGNNKTDGPE